MFLNPPLQTPSNRIFQSYFHAKYRIKKTMNWSLIRDLLLASILYCLLPLRVDAQGASELRAFKAAVDEFDDASYALAEKEFADFIRTFPESGHIPEAILYEARAALEQKKFKIVVGLLSTNAALAGALADHYRYSLGQAHLQAANYQAAADTFASLIKEFPNSNHLLAASYGEALARFKLKDWRRVIDLLKKPDSAFRKEALLRPADELATRGALLLAEALLEQKDYRAAEEGLGRLAELDLIPEFKWRRQYLLSPIAVADHALIEALAKSTNLLALAASSGDRNLLAESVTLQGQILEQLEDWGAAVQAYERNLVENVPAESARLALLKVSALTLSQNKLAEAALKLETFISKHPEDAASDIALLTLGELHLRQHFASRETNATDIATNSIPGATNHLEAALVDFD